MEATEYYIYKPYYRTPIYDCLVKDGNESFIHADREAVIFFVYSGELTISYHDETLSIKKGEYAFVQRDIIVEISKKNTKGEKFRSVFIAFDKQFLWWFYNKTNDWSFAQSGEKFSQNIIKLPYSLCLHSLYISFEMYNESGKRPTTDILSLKLQEGIYGLAMTDNRFYTCLFDFIYNHNLYSIFNNNLSNN